MENNDKIITLFLFHWHLPSFLNPFMANFIIFIDRKDFYIFVNPYSNIFVQDLKSQYNLFSYDIKDITKALIESFIGLEI